MALLANITHGFERITAASLDWLANYGSGANGMTLGSATNAPAQRIADAFIGQEEIMLKQWVDAGMSIGMSIEQVTDLRNVNSHGVALEVRGEDVDYVNQLREEEGLPAVDQPIKAGGANIPMVFNPYTTAEFVDNTIEAVDGLTNLKGAQFVSAGERTCMPEFIGVRLDEFSIVDGANGNSGNVAIAMQAVHAQDGTITGPWNALKAEGSNLSGLQSEGAQNLRLDITCSTLGRSDNGQIANFDGVTFAPDSRMASSHVEATFLNAKLDSMDFSHSRLATEGMFQGAVFGKGAHLNNAIVTSQEVLIGAIGPDGQMLTQENVAKFMSDNNMKIDAGVKKHGPTYAASPMREATAARGSDMAASATAGADSMIKALGEAYAAASPIRDVFDPKTDEPELGNIALAENNEINAYRVEHDTSIGRA